MFRSSPLARLTGVSAQAGCEKGGGSREQEAGKTLLHSIHPFDC